MQDQKLNQAATVAAYQIHQILRSAFKNEPDYVQQQGAQVIMSHVNRMLHGEQVTVEGPDLVTPVEEPVVAEPVPPEDKYEGDKQE